MAAGDLVVADKQLEIWRSDADRLLLGPTTVYRTALWDGLDLPAMRTRDSDKPTHHGAYGGPDYLAPRILRNGLTINEASAAALATAMANLGKAMRPTSLDDVVATFWLAGAKRRMIVRPRRLGYSYDAEAAGAFIVRAAIELVALDPIIYDSALTATPVLTIAASTLNVAGTWTNGGTFPVRPVITLVGPATNPRILNATDGNRQIKIDYALLSTDTMVIDVAKRTVLLNGADAYQYVRSDNQWFDLLPGANAITFSRSTAPAQTATATPSFRGGWGAI